MKVAVIGAGVVGLATAYYLHQAGACVDIFEREDDVALHTSKANGAQLSYSFTDAMASPDLLSKLPKILLGLDPALTMRPSFQPAFLDWGLRFLRNCNQRRAQKNSLQLLQLALRSAELMQPFHQQFGSEYCFKRAGKIVLLPELPSAAARDFLQQKAALGSDARYISFDEACSLEPSLQHWNTSAPSAVYSENDEVADAYRFAQVLSRELQGNGVRIHYQTPVRQLLQQGQRIDQVITSAGAQSFDAVVLCTGNLCPELLRPLGIRLPIYPVAGYSLTLPAFATSPVTSITALNKKIVFSRIGQTIRIAGFADINASARKQQQRTDALLATARELAPQAADYSVADPNPWLGYRPMTPDSLPIVGKSPVENLYVNMGHGMLGWTLCAATGEDIARRVINAPAECRK